MQCRPLSVLLLAFDRERPQPIDLLHDANRWAIHNLSLAYLAAEVTVHKIIVLGTKSEQHLLVFETVL
jgi:hypothetical protein